MVPIWALLAIAICAEVTGTTALRESDGFTRLAPVAVMVAAYLLSFYVLALIVRDFPLGLTYAIWAGAGTALIAVVGVFRFGESLSTETVGGIALIIAGIVTINFSGS